jgi:hypothetical protein
MNEEENKIEEPVVPDSTEISMPQITEIGYLEEDSGVKSSGRLMKMLSWGMAALIALLFAVPISVAYILLMFGIGSGALDVAPNNAFMIQTLFFGFLGLAGGTELIAKITKK